MVLTLGLCLALSSGLQQSPNVTFVLACQKDSIDSKSLDGLKQCQTLEQIQLSLQALHLEAQALDKETVFIFPNLSKLDDYIKQKRKVMDFYITQEVGSRSKPWDKVIASGSLPDYCYEIYKSTLLTSFNTRPSKFNPILPKLSCKVNFVLEEQDVTISIPMDRDVPTSIADKIRSLAPTEGGVLAKEKDLPKTLDEGIAKNPFVGYTLNGLTLNTWGKPVVNSKASTLLESYFKILRKRTEVSEEKLRALYRDFLSELARQDDLWKELSSLKDQTGAVMSDELRGRLYQGLISLLNGNLSDPVAAQDFLKKATVKKVYAEMSIVGPVLNSGGSLNMVGFVF